mmetsp:Transcript_58760/g.182241  ORF Transcript_58760/g.182241 Transcript_58760/m.182241 type:complete len:316 (+) Transcript_58760:650-1597(+)
MEGAQHRLDEGRHDHVPLGAALEGHGDAAFRQLKRPRVDGFLQYVADLCLFPILRGVVLGHDLVADFPVLARWCGLVRAFDCVKCGNGALGLILGAPELDADVLGPDPLVGQAPAEGDHDRAHRQLDAVHDLRAALHDVNDHAVALPGLEGVAPHVNQATPLEARVLLLHFKQFCPHPCPGSGHRGGTAADWRRCATLRLRREALLLGDRVHRRVGAVAEALHGQRVLLRLQLRRGGSRRRCLCRRRLDAPGSHPERARNPAKRLLELGLLRHGLGHLLLSGFRRRRRSRWCRLRCWRRNFRSWRRRRRCRRPPR